MSLRHLSIVPAIAICAVALSAGKTAVDTALMSPIAAAARLPGVVSVTDFGAVGDGKTDCTEAFRRAVEAATSAAEYGATVIVPPGTYLLTDTLEIRRCLLTGLAAGGWPADACPMPELEIAHSNGPAVVAGYAASIHGLSFGHIRKKGAPAQAPPTILLAGNGISITNVRIHGPYDGIIADGKSNIGRLNIENVFIVGALHCGLYITRTYDIPTVRNVEVWVPGKYNLAHGGVGFRLGRNDGLRMTNCFAFACGTGFLFDIDEGKGGGAAWAELVGCGTDFCGRGIAIQAPTRLGIYGGQFLDHQESLLVDHPGALVAVNGVMMQSNGAPAVVVKACQTTTLTGCQFNRAFFNPHRYLVEITGGEAVTVNGCTFSPDAPGIKVGSGARRVAIVGNVFATPAGQPTITVPEEAKGIVVAANVTGVPSQRKEKAEQ